MELENSGLDGALQTFGSGKRAGKNEMQGQETA
jgi:hypothetical protein